VVVRGLGFSHPGPASSLLLAGLPVNPADIHLWTPGRLEFWVPAGAATGDVRVRTEAGESNGMLYTVTGPSPTPDPRASLAWSGALSGTQIVISPGHGFFYSSAVGAWTTQRGLTYGLIEDIHTNQIAMDYLIPMLERAGATVHSCRERSRQTAEVIVQNEDGPPAYTETGTWNDAASPGLGFGGTDYRTAAASASATAEAVFRPDLPAEGDYPVWIWYRGGQNRVTDARCSVVHTGGVTEITLNQEIFSARWVYLGTFHFARGTAGCLRLSNASAQGPDVVVADTVRFGAGFGSIVDGGTTSGQPRWKEAARYWTEYAGAPSSVYSAGDVSCRGLYADWLEDEWGPAVPDAYLSLHTNAAATPDTGTGTSSFIHDTSPSPGSAALQSVLHTQLVSDIRALWDAGWVDRGQKTANFGELRNTDDMPALLVEIAFHDTATPDNDFLHLDAFRRDVSRALLKGMVRYLNPSGIPPPLPPCRCRAENLSAGRIRVSWQPTADSLEPEAAPTAYVLYTSTDGRGFDNGREVPGADSVLVDRLVPGRVYYFRVAAKNAGGESLPSETLAARVSADTSSRILLVSGFDRLDRYVRFYEGENTFDYIVSHAQALAAAEPNLYFDAAQNEAVEAGDLRLGEYDLVDWILGEESTADETLSTAEQEALTGYLEGGGNLLLSGSELAWDLDSRGSASDRVFLSGMLKIAYLADTSGGVYEVSGVSGSPFDGVASAAFDDGTAGIYNVDYPDVFSPVNGGAACLLYGMDPGKTAAVQYSGAYRIIVMGFPLETLVSPADREDFMVRAVDFFLK
jgi:N-acetylmuramoyl-L-alanine amidase